MEEVLSNLLLSKAILNSQIKNKIRNVLICSFRYKHKADVDELAEMFGVKRAMILRLIKVGKNSFIEDGVEILSEMQQKLHFYKRLLDFIKEKVDSRRGLITIPNLKS